MTTKTVVVGRIKHETNTFSSLTTDYEAFANTSLFCGDYIIPEFRGTNTDIGGFIRVADDNGWDIIPTVAANATPGGVVTTEALNAFLTPLVTEIERSNPDAVLLGLHGAMVSENKRDGDGEILKRVREAAGDIPILATLDLHANVTERMVANADGLFGYDTYPHVDIGETGEEAARVLASTFAGEINPQVVVERAPLLPPLPSLRTECEPMCSLLADAADAEDDHILDLSVFGGFAYADVPEAGFSVVGVSDTERVEETREMCEQLATSAYERRHEFDRSYTSVEEAVAEASTWVDENHDQPMLLADIADNPGGGSAQDGTVLLKALLNAEVDDVAVATLIDPRVVEAAVQAGVGERVTVELGGHIEDNGNPIEVAATVQHISDGTYRNRGPMSTGLEVTFGQTVVLECDGVKIIVGSHRQQPYDPEAFRAHGLKPERANVIVLKSTVHYRAGFEPLVETIREVAAPGLCSPDLSRFEYEHIPRPLYPLDENM
ncbi:M81 family metallopeptidase [Haladaptatus salinisoli]|uniref:M81 family metallopeptidase n=1 Tax=Haladaptatus salinisoli TaxID=2884876 RepID=UPI001D0B435B|nr:M81 family metallopeptidase [Haladaptatus salinisoli]